jgi:predicted RNA binding protein YcfA (HicA-like mRNA interferase family)
MPMKVREVIAVLERNGWMMVRQRGSHRVFRHPHNTEGVVVAGKRSDTVKRGTLAAIRRKSELKEIR